MTFQEAMKGEFTFAELAEIQRIVERFLSDDFFLWLHPHPNDFHTITGMSRKDAQAALFDWQSKSIEEKETAFLVFCSLSFFLDYLEDAPQKETCGISEIKPIYEKWLKHFSRKNKRLPAQ